MAIFLQYFLAWLPMLAIAIINGTLRDFGYKKYIGELAAHQASTVTLIIFFSLYINFIVRKFPPATSRQAIFLGLFWVIMTLAFEFGFGLMRGNTMDKLLADYNILRGRLWILIPAFLAVAPYLFFKLLRLNGR